MDELSFDASIETDSMAYMGREHDASRLFSTHFSLSPIPSAAHEATATLPLPPLLSPSISAPLAVRLSPMPLSSPLLHHSQPQAVANHPAQPSSALQPLA